MDAKSIERVVRGAVSTVLTRIVEDSRQTRPTRENGNQDSSDSETEDHLAIRNSRQVNKKKRYTAISCAAIIII